MRLAALAGFIISLWAFWWGLGFLVYAMYVFVGVALVGWLIGRHGVEETVVERKADMEVLETGESVEVTLHVSNHGRFPVPWLLVEDFIPTAFLVRRPKRADVSGKRLTAARLRPGEDASLNYSVRFHYRGYYPLGPVLLESGDVFGLYRKSRVVDTLHYVTVLPEVVPIPGYDIASLRPVGEVRMTHRLFEDPTRIAGVRPYQKGDPLNRIHWRATARTGTLQSKTYEPSTVAGATLVLDFHKSGYADERGFYRSELAVTTVASLAYALGELSQQVGLVTNAADAAEHYRELYGVRGSETVVTFRRRAETGSNDPQARPIRVSNDRAPGQAYRIREILARVQLNDGLDMAGLISECESRLARDASVVVVLPTVTARTATALGGLRRQGYSVTVVLILGESTTYRRWAQPPEWAGLLLAEGIDFRQVEDEEALSHLCGGLWTR